MTFTKVDIADSLLNSPKIKIEKQYACKIVDAIFENIRGALESGQSVKISGFGNFELRNKSARPGRNPKTGEEVEICERTVVTFHVGQKLKGMIDNIRDGV